MKQRARHASGAVLLGANVLAFLVVGAVGVSALGGYSGNHIAYITSEVQFMENAGVVAAIGTLIVCVGCFVARSRPPARTISWIALVVSWPAQLALIYVTFLIKY